jgi:hypothetical protein
MHASTHIPTFGVGDLNPQRHRARLQFLDLHDMRKIVVSTREKSDQIIDSSHA